MRADPDADVPSPIDLRTMRDAKEWADAVTAKRPWRSDFFAIFIDTLRPLAGDTFTVLELGSGPGFLAEQILSNLAVGRYSALDFSDAMHSLARQRLVHFTKRVEFLNCDFLDPHWGDGLPHYSAVVTLQAVHELRHKRHTATLYEQVRHRLRPGGIFAVCDHYVGDGGMTDDSLFMNIDEHRSALAQAGFTNIDCRLEKGGMVIHVAQPA
jgi:SAM-dependent methyltransferase